MRPHVPRRPSRRPHRTAPRLLGASRRLGIPRPSSPRAAASLPSGGGESGGGSPGLALDRALFERLRPWASGIARRIGASPGEIEDVVQEAFERVTRSAASFVPPLDVPRETAIRRWIVGILAHVVGSQNRRARRSPLSAHARAEHHGRRQGADDGRRDVDADDIDPADHGALVEARADLRYLLQRFPGATLPERWRAWLAFEIDGVDAAEIARQEGTPIGTVYNRVRLAREDLAAMLTREEAAAQFRITTAKKRTRR